MSGALPARRSLSGARLLAREAANCTWQNVRRTRRSINQFHWGRAHQDPLETNLTRQHPSSPRQNTQPVHLADVNPRTGPMSGGTRLYLSGSNLNVGSRVQVYLDDIPCMVDR